MVWTGCRYPNFKIDYIRYPTWSVPSSLTFLSFTVQHRARDTYHGNWIRGSNHETPTAPPQLIRSQAVAIRICWTLHRASRDLYSIHNDSIVSVRSGWNLITLIHIISSLPSRCVVVVALPKHVNGCDVGVCACVVLSFRRGIGCLLRRKIGTKWGQRWGLPS